METRLAAKAWTGTGMGAKTPASMGAESSSAGMRSCTVLRPGEVGKHAEAKRNQHKTREGSVYHTWHRRIVDVPDPTNRCFYRYPNAACARVKRRFDPNCNNTELGHYQPHKSGRKTQQP